MRRWAACAALILLSMAAARPGAAHDGGRPEPPAPLSFAFGGPFSLLDHNGVRRTDRDFHGRFLLVYFGYASCRSMCPLSLRRMAEALDDLGELAHRIQPLFITVDPHNDTVATLGTALAGIDSRLIGLTGTAAELRAAARVYKVRSRALTPPGDPDPVIDHGSFFYLMKPDGTFATLIPPVLEAGAMALTLRRHLLGSPPRRME